MYCSSIRPKGILTIHEDIARAFCQYCKNISGFSDNFCGESAKKVPKYQFALIIAKNIKSVYTYNNHFKIPAVSSWGYC